MSAPTRFATVKALALDALDDLVPELFGGGRLQTRRYGQRWAVANKWRGGRIDQMTVWRDAGRRGAWKDFVSGDKGDVIDLVAYGLTGYVSPAARMAAVEHLEDRFGIRAMSPEERDRLERRAARRREELKASEARRQAGLKRRVQKFFFSCAEGLAGTPAAIYLAGRGIVLEQVPQLSAAFRFRADCEYWPAREFGEELLVPAIVSAMATAGGALRACHYTFLEPDGSGKLDTRARGLTGASGDPLSAKLMFPSTAGLLVHASYGPGGLRPDAAAEAGQLDWWGITEGIEDALSAALGDARLRMFAAGSLSGLGGVPDHPNARGFLVFRDNDWGKAEAQAQFRRAVARLKSFGKPVEVLETPVDWGKDVNDALRAE